MSDRCSSDLALDRRSLLFGLGAAATATASFVPVVTATAVYAAPPALAPALGAPTPAVFWNLAYTDFTGVVAAYAPARRAKAVVARDLDPHAELLAG